MFRNSFLICFIITDIFCTLFDPSVVHFKIHQIEECGEAGVSYNIFVEMDKFKVVHQDGVNARFQGFIKIRRPVQINFRLTIHGLICEGPEDRICKHAFIRKFGYICRKLHEIDRPWYDFIKKRFMCPISIGYYNMGEPEMDINSLSYLPLDEGYWVIKTYGYQGSDVIMCVYSEIEIYPKNARKSVKNEQPKIRNITEN